MLTRRNRNRDLMRYRGWRNWMDRFFEDPFFDLQAPWETTSDLGLALDVSETEDEYLVKASVPGIDPDDLDISITNNMLTIQGEKKAEEEREGEQYHIRERRYGRFTRTISLPSAVNEEAIEANYEDGVLTLHMPKSEEAKPRRIEIKGGSGKKVIEG
jgi:HSP20 family protein